MTNSLREDVNAVLLPAFATTELSDGCKRFLDGGGVSLLLGETREEYVSRKMSGKRRKSESKNSIQLIIAQAKARTPDLLVAVDQEPGGICRLHDLVPEFLSLSNPDLCSLQSIEENVHDVAIAAKRLGVNCFLAPIVDLISVVNPWLEGRTLSINPNTVSQISVAFIKGTRKAGVISTAKHFPGFHNIELDPAVNPKAINLGTKKSYEPGFKPFREVINNGVEMIMIGPAIVQAFDESRSAPRSRRVVNMLKQDFNFEGVVLSDDLDSRATMLDDDMQTVAIESFNAGCDLLLLADVNNQLEEVGNALADAVNQGLIPRERLTYSANKVRTLARKYSMDLPL